MTATEFSTNQYDSAYPDGIDRHYWSRARNGIIRKQLQKAGIADKKILEIGCGRGVVLRGLRSAGIDCIGVELAPVSVPEDLHGVLHSGISYEDLDHDLVDSVEVVLLLDVIEHIEDEHAFMKKVLEFFPNLTHVVVTVPARTELWSNYDEHYGHFRRHTRKTLSAVAKQLGVTPLSIGYFFHALYIPARLLALMNLSRPTDIVPPKKGIATFLHAVISWYLRIERAVVPSFVPGTSIMGVFKSKKGSE